MKAVFFLILAFETPCPPVFPAHVLRCHDGDTCTVSTGQGTKRSRLADIHTPEIDQPYGTQARGTLCAIDRGRDVEKETRGISYDRIVGLILVSGVDTSEAMVRAGEACDYSRHDHYSTMSGLEQAARAGGFGLWADPAPVAPEDWGTAEQGASNTTVTTTPSSIAGRTHRT